MSSLKKTIKINPELFNLSGGNKTRNNREKKQIKTPLINPNSIKKKLLSRIKEHKNSENNTNNTNNENKTNKGNTEDIGAFTDEFMDSINYLTTLSKEKKETENNQHRMNHYANKTVKNHSIYANASMMPYVELELPEELRENPLVPVLLNKASDEPPIKIKSAVQEDVPYGCLKGGLKPTYRAWQSTRKNHTYTVQPPTVSISQPISLNMNENPIFNNNNNNNINISNRNIVEITEREKRLKLLQERIQKQKQDKENENKIMSQNLLAGRPEITNIQLINKVSIEKEKEKERKKEKETTDLESSRLIKRTIKKKYTLGKSANKKHVGILIKDNKTRKKILNAHKELKKKPINDVKKYLRDHGLLKAGSNAPNDVVRKIYESSMLTGDITNKNNDVLLHNFLNETSDI